jgi:adiponectin receptor
MGCSTICHLCFVHSDYICDVVAKLDYWGIAVLGLGSAYPQLSYKYACGHLVKARWVFVSIITVFCWICMFMTLKPQIVQSPLLRTGLFILFGMSLLVPLLYAYINYDETVAMPPAFDHLAIVISIYFIGVCFFLSRVPERWLKPGSVDYCGSSHNIFHCIVMVGIAVDSYYSWNLYLAR